MKHNNSIWFKAFLILIILLIQYSNVCSQQLSSNHEGMIPLNKFLDITGEKWEAKFYYRREWLDTIYVRSPEENYTLQNVFKIIRDSGLKPVTCSDWQYVLIWDRENPVYNEYDNSGNFSREILLTGKVKLLNTEEDLLGATVQVDELDTGTVTDYKGNYTLKIPTGTYHIRANSIGQQEELFWLRITKDTTLNFELADKVITLNEVIISEQSIDQNVNEVSAGKTRLDMLTIRGLPAFMGETDVVRSLIMMPGVSTVGEGASGFNVRGGAVDQNLVLIDQTPVFNSSHLFGLFSVFNQDVIKDVTLYKGGIPARFGGRLSSVLDAHSRDNITNKFSGHGGIGLITNRLTLDIPLVKDKMSIIAGGRGALNDFLLKLIPDPQISNSTANFYDTNVKYNYSLNKKNILKASYYGSFDRFSLPSDTSYFWGTNNLSVQWNHLFGKNLVGNFTTVYSKFRYGVDNQSEHREFQWHAGIEYRKLKADFTWLGPENHQIGFGGSFIRYDFKPGSLIAGKNSSINPIILQNDQSNESAIYAEDEYELSRTVSIAGGLRFSYYQAIGPSKVNIYEKNEPLKSSTIISNKIFSRGEVIKAYSGWEPRLSMKIGLSLNSSMKLSYNRMYQYIHLISNTTAVTPIDLWHPSNLYIRPEYSDQFSAGYFKNFLENSIETSLEVFYKDITDITDYKDGAKLVLNENIEEELLQGHGRAYGIEFLFRKKIGRLTGWLAYTWSRTEKKMESQFDEETINFGKYYPASYDHPNDLSVTATYKITRRWSMSANFVYMSGRPGTFPESKYVVDHFTIAGYGGRNQARIPDYHRLDISFTLAGNLKKHKKWDASWTFSVYNLYNRNNAYSVFFKSAYGSIPRAYKLSILGGTFPAITYNYSF